MACSLEKIAKIFGKNAGMIVEYFYQERLAKTVLLRYTIVTGKFIEIIKLGGIGYEKVCM